MSDNFNMESGYERILEIIEEYGTDPARQLREISSQVVYEKYGIGGEGLHRGCYCPFA